MMSMHVVGITEIYIQTNPNWVFIKKSQATTAWLPVSNNSWTLKLWKTSNYHDNVISSGVWQCQQYRTPSIHQVLCDKWRDVDFTVSAQQDN